MQSLATFHSYIFHSRSFFSHTHTHAPSSRVHEKKNYEPIRVSKDFPPAKNVQFTVGRQGHAEKQNEKKKKKKNVAQCSTQKRSKESEKEQKVHLMKEEKTQVG